jgi:hypothetical protein
MTSSTNASSSRHVRGPSIIDLVKILRKTQKARPLPFLSPLAQEMLNSQIIVSQWYPFTPFIELLEMTYVVLLKRNEQYAMEMGIAGGMNQLKGAHKVYLVDGNPKESAMAMRHTWRAHFDFGEVTAEVENDHAVALTLKGYSDVVPVHANLIAGFAVAAARLTGSPNASGEVFERPWNGAPYLRYRVRF